MQSNNYLKILLCAVFAVMLIITNISIFASDMNSPKTEEVQPEIDWNFDREERPVLAQEKDIFDGATVAVSPDNPNTPDVPLESEPDLPDDDFHAGTIVLEEISEEVVDVEDEKEPDAVTQAPDACETIPQTVNDMEDTVCWNPKGYRGYFIENRGQLGQDEIRYYSNDGSVWFTDSAVWFNIRKTVEPPEFSNSRLEGNYQPPSPVEPAGIKGAVVRMDFVDANLVTPSGIKQLGHANNYFIGSDPDNWLCGVPGFEEIYYRDIYRDIDLRFYQTEAGLKYDFLVHPGGNSNIIKLGYTGSDSISMDINDGLVISSPYGNIHDKSLYVYQSGNGKITDIPGAFELISDTEYGFSIEGDYNENELLIIDPTLVYSTYVGGSGYESGNGLAVDKDGYVYITSYSVNTFPTTPGAYDTTYNNLNNSMYPPASHGDVVVIKLDPKVSKLIYSTFIGGNDSDIGLDIEIDKYGNAYITGRTKSLDFPTTQGAYDRVNNYTGIIRMYDAFVVKLGPNGSKLSYSTFIGGSSFDTGIDLEVDSNGNSYLTGETYSMDFPTTAKAYDRTYNGGDRDFFSVKLNSKGTGLIYSTLIGGSGDDHSYGMALDSNDCAVLTGYTHSYDFPVTAGAYDNAFDNYSKSEAVVLKLSKDGSSLLRSTFIGGKRLEWATSVAIDRNDNVHITGATRSSDFPVNVKTYNTTPPEWNNDDVFVAKFDANLSKVLYSTLIGGKSGDIGQDIALDGDGNVYVVGDIYSSDFPTTKDAMRNASSYNTFFIRLDPKFSELNYSTALDAYSFLTARIEIISASKVYISGVTSSANMPTTDGVYSRSKNGTQDIFVMKFKFTDNEPPEIASFTASSAVEGSCVVFSVSAQDPENDPLLYEFDFTDDGTYDLSTNSSTATYLWPDDHSGTAAVRVSDGENKVVTKTAVLVQNGAPVLGLETEYGTGDKTAVLYVRIAGEKWHDVKVELYKNDVLAASDSLVRTPGSPNEQTLGFPEYEINDRAEFRAELYYTPEDDPGNGKTNGATPCWVILKKENGDEVKLHHTFNVKQEHTHDWSVDLTDELENSITDHNVTFLVTLEDPGADSLLLNIDFGDGTNTTFSYPNNNGTYPVMLELTFDHVYESTGTYTVELIATDDDGGSTTITVDLSL